MQMKESLIKLLLLVFLVTLTIGCDQSSHPSDQALEKQFSSQENDFNKLVTMSNEDSNVIRIANDFTRLRDNWAWPRPESEIGVSRQRWNDYKNLFNKLGLEAGLTREDENDPPVIFLKASAVGIVNRGSAKGYAYSAKELSPSFNSLDQNPIEPEKRQRHGVAYKKIKTNWYLYLDW